jgi:paraquat-inducible protein A
MTAAPTHYASAGTLRECLDCGLIQTIPKLAPKTACHCGRCGKPLRHTRSRSSLAVLALSLTSMVLYFIAVWSPFLSVTIVGQQRETTMGSLPAAFVENGMWEVGAVVLLTSIVMPFCKIAVVLITLLGLRTANPPQWLPALFRQYRHIGPWAMVEVFLLGVFVAFTRLQAIATVTVGVALYALGALMLTMVLTDYLLDREGIWEEMAERGLVSNAGATASAFRPISCENCGLLNAAADGAPCHRCRTTLHRRKPQSIARTWALLATGVLCYLPANLYPILTLVRLGSGAPSTILGGARELLDAGMWPLALLVLVASVLVPAFKLIGLVFMLIETHRGSTWRLRDRTRLYRVIDFIGRWSMIDVFMLSTLIGLVQDGKIAEVTPGFGAICFASVVIVTMFAASCFDPRLMWDAAARRSADAPARSRASQASHA